MQTVLVYMVKSRRAPAMLWYRLKHELRRDGWLTVRVCENVSVNQWTNSVLSEAVERRYLSDQTTRRQLHDVLFTYWLGASSVDEQQQGQYGQMNDWNQRNSNNSRVTGPAVIYDIDQPLMFACDLAPGKPRYLRARVQSDVTELN